MTSRSYWRLFVLNLAISAYMWGLGVYIAANGGEEGSIWPFLPFPLAMAAWLWLLRKLRRDVPVNKAIGPMKRRQWESHLVYWAPISSFAYLWLSARRTGR